jgi:hypothetical protein
VTKGEVAGGKGVLTVEPSKGGAASTLEADVVLVSIGVCGGGVVMSHGHAHPCMGKAKGQSHAGVRDYGNLCTLVVRFSCCLSEWEREVANEPVCSLQSGHTPAAVEMSIGVSLANVC